MSGLIHRFDIAPDFRAGFGFSWGVDPTLSDPLPWRFTVEVAETAQGPWSAHTQTVENVAFVRGGGPIMSPAAPALFFRLRLQTPVRTVYSADRVPAQRMSRHQWLAARAIMRDASAQYNGMGGVCLALWQRALYGPACSCANEITGETEDSRCAKCYGTGRQRGYIGPVDVTGMLEARKVQARREPEAATTEAEPQAFETLAAPLIRSRDVLIDHATGRRYIAGAVKHLAAIRGIPLVVSITLATPATSDPIYGIGGAL